MKFLKRLMERLLPDDPVPVDERRESVRLDFRVDVTVLSGTEEFPATVVNLTFTGLCLESASSLSEDQEVTLKRDDLGPPFKATVLWTKPLEEGGHVTGLQCELDEDRLIESWLEPALIQAGFEAKYVDEQRQLVRVPGKLSCEMRSLDGDTCHPVELLDLSLGGALVEAGRELNSGDSFKLKTVPKENLSPLEAEAMVTSVRATQAGKWLCGLRFINSRDDEVRACMKSMLDFKPR
jgi:hypothetical protein